MNLQIISSFYSRNSPYNLVKLLLHLEYIIKAICIMVLVGNKFPGSTHKIKVRMGRVGLLELSIVFGGQLMQLRVR